jgi:hypothetical protein
MKATTIGLSAAALLVSGCIVREVREIHHVRDNGTRAPGDTGATPGNTGTCDGCDSGAAPGAMMADSQPPPPLVEEALDQPGDGYVWTDGYWHWNGTDWVWIPGTWYPPVETGVVFIPPSYYTSGPGCLYVPGRWQRDPRMASVRDHRTRKPGHGSATGRRPVRDHRTKRAGVDGKPPRSVRDHRGEKPADVDRDVDIDPDFVIRVPARRFRGRPAAAARPDRSPARADDDLVRIDGDRVRAVDVDRDGRDSRGDRVIDDGGGRGIDAGGSRGIDGGGGRGIDAGGDRPRGDMPDHVIVRPRPDRLRPDRRPGRPDVSGPGSPPRESPTMRGQWVRPMPPPSRGARPVDVSRPGSPPRESPPMRGQWVRPMPPSRGAPPVMVPPSRAPSSPIRVGSQPVRTMTPRPVSPPPRAAQPAAPGQPRPPASAPANAASRARQATPRAPRTMSSPRR